MINEDKKPNIVLFLGAGASRSLGIPLSGEFFAKKEFEGFRNKDTFIALARTYRTDPESVDLEALLTDTEHAKLFLNKGSDLYAGIETRKVVDLGEEVKRLVYDRCTSIDPYGCLEQYRYVFYNLCPGKFTSKLSVFTTNYDRAIESCFSRWEPSVGYCGFLFSGEPLPRLWDGFVRHSRGGLVWSKEAYGPPKEVSSEGTADFRLFKLHGSVGWIQRGNTVVEVDSSSHASLPKDENQRPLVVYPGPDSLLDPISSYARGRLVSELREADWVVVVGFSFRDDEISEAFQQAHDSGAKFRGYLIDPSANALRERVQSKFPEALFNLESVPKKFGQKIEEHCVVGLSVAGDHVTLHYAAPRKK
jgi:hypothetical protein